jgi:hypothetical protein
VIELTLGSLPYDRAGVIRASHAGLPHNERMKGAWASL